LSENRSPGFGIIRDEGIGRGALNFSHSVRPRREQHTIWRRRGCKRAKIRPIRSR